MAAINTVGRRKTSVARAYLMPGTGTITINGRALENYFPSAILRQDMLTPFAATQTVGQFDVKINVNGGGVTGQAQAARLAIARALTEYNEENRPALRAESLLTRDPRMVERKKFGKRKARKRFQFSKR
jgi:small subunit ribosomal protein S9